MKNLYLCLGILILCASCSNDLNTVEEGQSNATFKNGNSRSEVLSSNNNNPYENVGELYHQLSEIYHGEENLPSNVSDIVNRVELLANANSDFNNLKGTHYQSVNSDRVQYIVEHQNACVSEVIANSSMSSEAKRIFSSFIDSLVPFFDGKHNFDNLYDYILKYENAIINNPMLTANDKRIILVTTSIARHSIFKVPSSYMFKDDPRKNTDPDWGVLVGNIIATTEGVEESTAKAISLSLAVDATNTN